LDKGKTLDKKRECGKVLKNNLKGGDSSEFAGEKFFRFDEHLDARLIFYAHECS
jgi:hypothetical protein